MQAYSRAGLAPLRAASSVSSVSSRAKGADSAVAMGAAERPVDVASAAQAFASLLLEGLSNQDLAAFARRLLPHLQERQRDGARAHSAYTVASLAAELGVSDKAIRCAITRRELRAVKRGSRWIISADAVEEWATAPDGQAARARRRPAPLPAAPKAAGPSLRSILCSEGKAARREARGGSR
jgi:excisionase family DNA binding protein